MVFWSGWGFLVILVLVVGLYFGVSLFHDGWWGVATGLLLAAAGNFGVSHLLDRRKERVLIDAATRQPVTLRNRDSLFFIPVRYWSSIFLVLGLILVGVALVSKR
jgi:hypothetical protein